MSLSTVLKRRIIILVFIFLIIFIVTLIISNLNKEVDITNAIHGIVVEDSAKLYYKSNKFVELSSGENVYIIEDDILNNKYKIKFNDLVGTIDKTSVDYFRFDDKDKYSIMCDVSQFNKDSNFKNENEFELFILNSNINYVYIRIGGRGWGQKGNMYYDSDANMFIKACEYLGVPYGFYYLDEALNTDEILEEVSFVKTFLNENKTSMNVLPLAIDIEYQEGNGRADNIWDSRTNLLSELIERFKLDNIETIVYVNGLRGEKYLTDLDTSFWVARYPQNDIIPDSFYSTVFKYYQLKNFYNQVINEDGKVNSKFDTNQTYEIPYKEEFLDKVIAWQFSESGASKDNINESLDLSIVLNSFFKQYIDKENDAL